ncbi:MAG: outer membrane beta-barrel protein [Pseudomonadota bacterium]
MTTMKTAGLVAIAATALSPAAFAQDYFARDRYQAVTDRFQPDFDQEPIRVGTFLASPQAFAGVEVTDNVFAVPDRSGDDAIGTQDDIIGVIGVSSGFQSDWGRHEMGGDVGVTHRQFFDFSDESFTTLNANVRGSYEVSRDFSLDGNVFGVTSADPRTSEAVRDIFEEPVDFRQVGATVQANYTRDRIRLQAFASAVNSDFDDASISEETQAEIGPEQTELFSDQSFRNNTLARVGGQVAYAISPDIAVYGEAEVNARDYDRLTPLAGGTILADRDSEGYRLEVGTDFELPNLLRGNVSVGYLEETRDDPNFVDFDGLSLDATLNWFPTRLTTVTFGAGQRAVDVGVLEAGGALETDLGVRVDHELRRNVLLFGTADFINRDFDTILIGDTPTDREDETILAGFGATYKVSKRFHVDAGYAYFDRSSNIPAVEFTRNAFTLTLRVFP